MTGKTTLVRPTREGSLSCRPCVSGLMVGHQSPKLVGGSSTLSGRADLQGRVGRRLYSSPMP